MRKIQIALPPGRKLTSICLTNMIPRLRSTLPVVFLLTATFAVQAQLLITSGSISGSTDGPGGGSMSISGTNFSLSCSFDPPPGVVFTGPYGGHPTYGGVLNLTFDPSLQSGARCSSGSATYNGAQYAVFDVGFNFVAPQVEVASLTDGNGNYRTNISNLPFTMTGTALMCLQPASPPPVTPYNCPQEISVSLSGSGVYSEGVVQNVDAGGPGGEPNGGANYQFTNSSGFVLDTTTKGGWQGTYGSDGYLIADGPTYEPSYAYVGFSSYFTYTWVGQTPDVRGVQNTLCTLQNYGDCNPSRTASAFAWYGPNNSFTISVIFTDNLVHRVALYLLDWDLTGRQQAVSIQENGLPFDTETFSNFQSGQYGAWNLMGYNVITITPIGPSNPGPVVSGIFFGPGVGNVFFPPTQ